MSRTQYRVTVTRQYRISPQCADRLRRIVEADSTTESETIRRIIDEEAARRGLAEVELALESA